MMIVFALSVEDDKIRRIYQIPAEDIEIAHSSDLGMGGEFRSETELSVRFRDDEVVMVLYEPLRKALQQYMDHMKETRANGTEKKPGRLNGQNNAPLGDEESDS